MEQMSKSSWKDLPTNLLDSILRLLDDPVDILRFRSICLSWRCFAKGCNSNNGRLTLPLQLPFPISPSHSVSPHLSGNTSLILSSAIYLVQPLEADPLQQSQCWLKIKKQQSGKFVLLNPMSSDDSPIASTALSPNKYLNLLDYRVTPVEYFYRLPIKLSYKWNSNSGDEADEFFGFFARNEWILNSMFLHVTVGKVVFDAKDVIFGMYEEAEEFGFYFFRRISDGKWVVLRNKNCFSNVDVAIHKGKYYGLDVSGSLTVIDAEFNIIATLEPPCKRDRLQCGFALIASFGDLFLVYIFGKDGGLCLSTPQLSCCTVFKLKEGNNLEWEKVDSLDGRTFFLSGRDHFSFMGKDLPGCRENSIYCKPFGIGGNKSKVDEHEAYYGGICLFDVTNGESGPLASFPGAADVFWLGLVLDVLRPINADWRKAEMWKKAGFSFFNVLRSLIDQPN